MPTLVLVAPGYTAKNAVTRKLYNAWGLLEHPPIITDDDQYVAVRDLAELCGVDELRVAMVGELTGSDDISRHQEQSDDIILNLLLRSNVSGSLSAMTSGLMWGAFGELLHSVQTGRPGFDKIYGMPMWRHLIERDPAAGVQFNAAMIDASTAVNLPIAQAADLTGVRSLIDVGGGQGGLLTALLATHPENEPDILFDQPHVIDEVQAPRGPTGRATPDGPRGFFTAVPAGADAYLMKWILHDWDDAACLQVLSSYRRAMAFHNRLLVVELVIDPDRSHELAYALDLQMLVALAGKERMAAEFHALYDAAGLQLTRIIPTASMFSVIEGIPQSNGQDRS